MAFKFLKHRHHKIGFGILVVFVVFTLVLALLINNYWSPILANKVRSAVLTSTDSLYKADFSEAELQILRGNIVLYNITLKPDTAVYHRMIKNHTAPNNLVELHVRRLILEHIHPFKLYFEHKLNISRIILNDPTVHITYNLNHTKDTVVKDHRTAWQKMSKSLSSVHIGNIYLNNIKLKYDDYSGNKVEISELKEMNFSASDLLIDSTTQTDRTRLLYCKEITAEINNYKGTSVSGLYTYKIRHIKLSTLTSQLNIEGLKLEPVNAKTFFDNTKKDRYTLELDSLQLNHFDYLSYHKYRTFSVSSIIASNGSIALFNNPGKKKTPEVDKINSFPAIALARIKTDFRIDTAIARNITVSYSEYNDKSYKSGTITFDHTSGKFFNITNNKAAITKNPICSTALSTHFMNRGRLNLWFKFNLSDPSVPYSYHGELGPMDLENLNQATMPFAMVKITNGTLKHFNFNIDANAKVAKGKVELLYNDLKIKLLSPDTVMQGFSGKLIESLYANIFIIKHNNPDNPGEAPRTFTVNYVRPKDSPFFKTIWNTLLAGIKPSAGLDEKTQKATEDKVNEMATNKQLHLQKKAARKARRAAKKKQKELEKQQKQGK